MSLGSAHFCGFLHYSVAEAFFFFFFCENSARTVRACELSPCFCSASVFSLFEKVGGHKGVGFFNLMGVALFISTAVGVLTDSAVGKCLRGRKNDGGDKDVCVCFFFFFYLVVY